MRFFTAADVVDPDQEDGGQLFAFDLQVHLAAVAVVVAVP